MSEFSELKEELELAINNSNINNYVIDNGKDILSEIEKIYVKGNPRAWWLSLKSKEKTISFEDNTGYKHIGELVSDIQGVNYNPGQNVFLIASEDDELEYIYNINLNKISSIIESCRYFEYYVVAHDLSWLICENDHGDIIICKNN